MRRVAAFSSLLVSTVLAGAVTTAPAQGAGSNPELVSTDANGHPTENGVYSHSLSDDGTKVVYTTNYDTIWLRDRTARKPKVVFHDDKYGTVYDGHLSGNGRFLHVGVADKCGCDDPTPAQFHDLFKDLKTGQVREFDNDLADSKSLGFVTMTSDGRYAFFQGDDGIYRWDTRTTSRLTRVAKGDDPAVSSDGSVIAYDSGQNVYVRKLPDGKPVLVNTTPDGKPTTSEIKVAPQAVSDDGRFVLYFSAARNLDPRSGECKDNYGVDTCLYLRDTRRQSSQLVSVVPGGKVVPASSGAMSDDGAQIAFQSDVDDSEGSAYQIYQRSRATGATHLISANANGEPAEPYAERPQMDARGDTVTFLSPASNFGVKVHPDLDQVWAVH